MDATLSAPAVETAASAVAAGCAYSDVMLKMLTAEAGIPGAVILAYAAAVAWFFKLFFDSLSKYIKDKENSVDIIVAIDHEIKENTEAESHFCDNDEAPDMSWRTQFKQRVTAHEEAGRKFKGFTATSPNDRIFRPISGRIFDLPRRAIDPIVDYYNVSDGLLAGIISMQSTDFENLDRQRKFEVIDNVAAVARTAVDCGQAARHAIATASFYETGKMRVAECARFVLVALALIVLIYPPMRLLLHVSDVVAWAKPASCPSPPPS